MPILEGCILCTVYIWWISITVGSYYQKVE
jgi:hypothetical protein